MEYKSPILILVGEMKEFLLIIIKTKNSPVSFVFRIIQVLENPSSNKILFSEAVKLFISIKD